MPITSKYIEDTHDAQVRVASYANAGVVALQLFAGDKAKDAIPGELLATATVNLPGQRPAEGNVFIKDWSENEGLRQSLEDNGIIGPVIRTLPTEFAEATEHALLIDPEGE